MTRTQILLDAAQYRWLTAQARRQRKSVSQLLRELVDARRSVSVRGRQADPLFKLAGLGRHETAADVAAAHDRYLYGAAKRRPR